MFSSAGGIVTMKRNRLGDETVDAFGLLKGSHGLAGKSEIKGSILQIDGCAFVCVERYPL